MGLAQALHHGILLAVSAQSTTGFSTLDPASLADLPKGVLILAMLIGGSVGSTAGGTKILRFLLLLRLLQLFLRRASVTEHAVVDIRLGGRMIGDAEFARALLMAALFWAVILVSWLIFLALWLSPAERAVRSGIRHSHGRPVDRCDVQRSCRRCSSCCCAWTCWRAAWRSWRF